MSEEYIEDRLYTKAELIQYLYRERITYQDSFCADHGTIAPSQVPGIIRSEIEFYREVRHAVEAEREAIYKAFEPTSEMKAELIGEFKVNQPYWDGENECEEIQEISIPWTATKDIIKAVVKHVRLIRNKQ